MGPGGFQIGGLARQRGPRHREGAHPAALAPGGFRGLRCRGARDGQQQGHGQDQGQEEAETAHG